MDRLMREETQLAVDDKNGYFPPYYIRVLSHEDG